MKKLTKKESEKICEDFNLGRFFSIKLIDEGWVNYNHDLKTEKGNFIVRFVGKTYGKGKKEYVE